MSLIPKIKINPVRLAGIIVLLLTWEVAAIYVKSHYEFSTQVLPPIEYVVTVSFPGLATFGAGGLGGYDEPSYLGALVVLSRESLATLARVLGGTFVGLVLGVGAGLLMWWSGILRRIIEPVILLIRNVPPLALMPLFLLWFGAREIGSILFIVFAVSMMVVINTTTAIRNLAPVYQRYALTLGATRAQILKTVIVPAITPEVAGGIRVILAMAWAITLGAEFLGAQSGIGRIILFSMSFLATGRMIVILILFVLYAFIIYRAFGLVIKYTTRWMP